LDGEEGSGERSQTVIDGTQSPIVAIVIQAAVQTRELSSGRQKRVSIARAVVKNPKLILADKPTANFDSATSISTLNTLHAIEETHRSTVVLCTHDSLVNSGADRVIEITDGELGV
jgi:putative ABC transport system ATP-binding protein